MPPPGPLTNRERLLSAYHTLELPPGSGFEEIRNAYRDLAQVWHPDRYESSAARLRDRANEKFKQITAAYSLLKEYCEKHGTPTFSAAPQPRPQREAPPPTPNDDWQYQSHGVFQERMAIASFKRPGAKGIAYGYVNEDRRVVIGPLFAAAAGFSEGLAVVRPLGSGLWGYIDAKGAFVIPAQFDYAESFSGRRATVSKSGRTWQIYNTYRK